MKYLVVFEIANPSNGVRGRVGPPLRQLINTCATNATNPLDTANP